MAKRAKRTIGRIDKVDLPEFGVEGINAKIDTGAYRSSMHCKNVHTIDGHVIFDVKTEQGYKRFVTGHWVRKKIKSSNGKIESRYIIKTQLKIFGKVYTVSFSLTDRSKMKNPILLGRKFLKNRFIVDVSESNLSFKKKQS